MAIEFDLGLIADAAQIDAGGKLSVLGEFRYIFAQTVPAVHGHMAVVARWTANTTDVRQPVKLVIDIVNSDGKPIAPRSPEVTLQFAPIGPAARGIGKVQAQLILQVNAIALPTYGDYAIHFLVNGVQTGNVPFHVAKAPGAPNDAV